MRDSETTADNVVSGAVAGAVVQAASISGGVHVHAGATPQTPIPRQLLPAPARFADRAQEWAELDRLLVDAGPRVAVLCGPGGVGKTALALAWLHEATGSFPNGQLFADLGAFNADGPTRTSEILGRFLRALGVPATSVPGDLAEQAALYRSLTAGVAILLDNAESVAQVRPLLPAAPTSVAVVTSRWRLSGLVRDGAFLLTLDPLEPAAAVELLTHSVGHARVADEPDPAGQLVELCGRMPLAVAVAGARLAARPRRTIRSAVSDLTDRQNRLAHLAVDGDVSVEAVLDLSYRELPDEAARFYRLVGLHPGPEFGCEVTAAAVEVPVARAGHLLDRLVDASLVTDSGEDRFRLHDLLRVHAAQRAEQDEEPAAREAAVRRMIEWYLHTTVAADRVVIPLGWRAGPLYADNPGAPVPHAGSADALDWLEAELPNLMAALRTAASHEWDELVWQLSEAMWALLLYRRPVPEWITATRIGIVSANRCGNVLAESRLHHQLGFAFHGTEQFEEAEREAIAALTLARQARHELGEEEALQLYGLALRSRGRVTEAIARYQEALAIDRRTGHRRGAVLALRRLGQALCELDRYEEAIQHLQQAIREAAELSDGHVEAMTLAALGSALTRGGRPEEAIGPLERSSAMMRESGSFDYQATILIALGDARERGGDLLAAREHFRQAVDLHIGRRDPRAQRARDRLTSVERRLMESPPPA